MKKYIAIISALIFILMSTAFLPTVSASQSYIADDYYSTGLSWEDEIYTASSVGLYSRMASLPNGDLIIGYTDNNLIYAKKSTDGGVTWGAPVRVTPQSYGTDYGYLSTNAFPFVDDDGNILITYRANKEVYDGTGNQTGYYSSIRISKSTDGGVTWSSEADVDVVIAATAPITNGSSGFREPQLYYIPTADGTRHLAVYYASDALNGSVLAEESPVYDNFNSILLSTRAYPHIVVQYIDGDGEWSNPALAVDGVARQTRYGMPTITELIDGSFAMVLESAVYGSQSNSAWPYQHNMIIRICFSKDGITWDYPRNLAIPGGIPDSDDTVGAMAAAPFVVTLPSGRIAVSYMSDRNSGTANGASSSYNCTMRVIVSDSVITYDNKYSIVPGSKSTFTDCNGDYISPHFSASSIQPIEIPENGYSIWPTLCINDDYLLAIAGVGYNKADDSGRVSSGIRCRRAVIHGTVDDTDITGLFWDENVYSISPIGGYARAVVMPDGKSIIAGFSAGPHVYAAISADGGKTWSNRIQVTPDSFSTVDGLSSTNAFPFSVKDGEVWMAYRSQRSDSNGTYTSIRISKSTDNGLTWSSADDVDIVVSGTASSFNGFWEPQLYYISDGNDGEQIGIYYSADAPDNIAFGSDSPTYKNYPTMNGSGGQNIVLHTWNGTEWGEPVVALDGRDNWLRNGMQTVAKLSDGSFVMVTECNPYGGHSNGYWPYRHDMTIQIAFSQDGITWTEPRDLFIPGESNYDKCASPFVVTLPDGRIAVSFMCNRNTGTEIGDDELRWCNMRVVVSKKVVTYSNAASTVPDVTSISIDINGDYLSNGFAASSFTPIPLKENGFAMWPSLLVYENTYLMAVSQSSYFTSETTDRECGISVRRANTDMIFVDSAEDFMNIGANGVYVITSDIDLADSASSQTERRFADFTDGASNVDSNMPMSIDNPFKGTIIGNGHTISGIYIDTSESDENTRLIGLFGAADGAVIRDLTIEGTVAGTQKGSFVQCTGGLVGYARNTRIYNCTSNITIPSGANYVGGIAGYAVAVDSGTTVIEGCTNNGTITANGHKAGIVGFIETERDGISSSVINCVNSASATITGTSAYTAGIIGVKKTVLVEGCVNRATVNGGSGQYTAGIVAYCGGQKTNNTDSRNIDNIIGCKNYGDISSDCASNCYVGGIVGYQVNPASIPSLTVTVGCCENSGDISAVQYAGGIAGYISGTKEASFTKIEFCENSGNITTTASGNSYSGGIAGLLGGGSLIGCKNSGTLSSGTGNSLGGIAGIVKNYGAVVDSGDTIYITGCYNSGRIDANTEAGSNTSVYAQNIGGIVGFLETGKAGTSSSPNKPITVTNCKNVGTVSGYTFVGGCLGHVKDTLAYNTIEINSISNEGNVTAGFNYAGGIAGRLNAALAFADSGNEISISECENKGNITGASGVGGIAGDVSYRVFVSDCFNGGKITGTNRAGGIVGTTVYTENTLTDNTIIPHIAFIENGGEITNCINTGKISGASYGPIGGIPYLSSNTNKIYTENGDNSAAASVDSICVHDNYYINDNDSYNVCTEDVALSGTDMLFISKFPTIDCDDMWGINGSIPYIRSLTDLFADVGSNAVYLKNGGSGDGKTPYSPIGDLDSAFIALDALGGGSVVIIDDYTISERVWSMPDTDCSMRITSRFEGVDFRSLNGAKLTITYPSGTENALSFVADMTFDNLRIKYDNRIWIYCNFNNVVFGEWLSMSPINSAEDVTAPIVCLGYRATNTMTAAQVSLPEGESATVEFNSGEWASVRGGNRRASVTTAPFSPMGVAAGDTCIRINGGEFGIDPVTTADPKGLATRVSAVGMNGFTGNAYVVINGGKFNTTLIGIASAGAGGFVSGSGYAGAPYSGDIYFVFNGGRSTTGSIYGNCTLLQDEHNATNTIRSGGSTNIIVADGNYSTITKLTYNSAESASKKNLFIDSSSMSSLASYSGAERYDSSYGVISLPNGVDGSDITSVPVKVFNSSNGVISAFDAKKCGLLRSYGEYAALYTPANSTSELVVGGNTVNNILTGCGKTASVGYNGFAVRIDNTPGIRFTASIDENIRNLTTAVNGFSVVEYGVLAKAAGNSSELRYFTDGDDGSGAATVKNCIGKSVSFFNGVSDTYKKHEGGKYYFTTVLVNPLITAPLYGTADATRYFNIPFTFRAYVRYTDGTNDYIMYGNEFTRSVAQVSHQAQQLGYAGNLIDAAADAWDGTEY